MKSFRKLPFWQISHRFSLPRTITGFVLASLFTWQALAGSLMCRDVFQIDSVVPRARAGLPRTDRNYDDYLIMFTEKLTDILNQSQERSFWDRMRRRRQSFHWVDLAAGEAYPQRAVLDGRVGLVDPTNIRATAVNATSPDRYDMDEIEKLQNELPAGKFRYFYGQDFEKIKEEIGLADVITAYGTFNKQVHLDQSLGRALSLLKKGSTMFVVFATDRTSFQDVALGSEFKFLEYLKRVQGIESEEIIPQQDQGTHAYLIHKLSDEVHLPELEVTAFSDQLLPSRLYEIKKSFLVSLSLPATN